MPHLPRALLLAAVLPLTASLAVATALPAAARAATHAGELGLEDALQAALARNAATPVEAPFTASAWLAALPSIDASYLQSQEDLGTDETEIGINLPLKSPYLREQDARLRELDDTLAQTSQALRALYYSGLVREAAWSARIAAGMREQAERRIALLEDLAAREQALFEARATTRYGLLLMRQELVTARLEAADQRAQEQRWLGRFRALTGMTVLPADLEEADLPGQAGWQSHPELQLLDLRWEQEQAMLAAGSERAAPWQLRLGAKRVETPALDETQYGVSVEIPLGLLNSADEASRSGWREAARSYDRERDQLRANLAQSWQQLQQEAEHLHLRQALLEEAAEVSAEVRAQAQALRDQNELGRELWISRLIADLERQSEVNINRLLIGQNGAMRRQAAGIPL
ncbi:TolC family protein [Mangrovimicrobium sediminis]|nr:TolC family protein [Haliea sp. SAOS-164]